MKRMKKRKKRRDFGLMVVLAVCMVSLGLFYDMLHVRAEVNEYDFDRTIMINLDGGYSDDMYWMTQVDRTGLGWEAGSMFDDMAIGKTVLDKMGVAHTVEAREGNEYPREGSFYQHADFVGVTPYVYIKEPTCDGWDFVGWDTNTEYESVEGGYWRFECGCYAADSGDIYINALWAALAPPAMQEVHTITINAGIGTFDTPDGSRQSSYSKPFVVGENSYFLSASGDVYYDWLTVTVPTRTGYIFNGWAVTEGTGSIGKDSDGWLYYDGSCHGDVTISAKWKSALCTITVNHYVCGTDGNYPEQPTKTGSVNKLTGTWISLSALKDCSLETEGGISYSYAQVDGSTAASMTVPGSGVTINLYYARQKHNVTYNVAYNGGTWQDGSTANRTEQIYYGAPVNLGTAGSKDGTGWKQSGWSTDPNAASSDRQLAMGTEDITLYAVYYKDIVLDFIDCMGSTQVNTTIYNNAEEGFIDVPDIRAFSGWENVSNERIIGYNSRKDISSSGADACEIPSGKKKLSVRDSGTYYAVYAADALLEYILNGGMENDSTKPLTETIYRNAADMNRIKGFELTLGESVKTTFDADGYIHSYQFAVWAENGDTNVQYPANVRYTLSGDTVMYAVWNEDAKPIAYTVVYDANGNGVQNLPLPAAVQYDQQLQVPFIIPERAGFTFVGWNTRADGEGTVFLPGETVKNLTTINLCEVRLYAQWQQRHFMLIKTASSRYNDTLVKRTPGDDSWYDTVGKLTISQLMGIKQQQCVQRWTISKEGIIARVQ